VNDASTDPVQIDLWWQQSPDANIGIATGVPSGLVVFDIDPRNGGDQSYKQLQIDIPDAFKDPLEVRTGSGGLHLYFESPNPIPSRDNIRPGIDIKADGGYVVAPNSRVSGSRYRFVGLVPRPLPAVLLDLILGGAQAQATGKEPPKVAATNDEQVTGRENDLRESSQEKSPASVPAELEAAREKPGRDDRAKTNGGHKPRLLIEICSPDRTVARLRDILATGGTLYDRGVPVRLAFDKQHQGTVAQVMTPDDIVLEAHQVCRPYVLKAKKDGTFYEVDACLPRSCAQMYLGWRGAWQLPRLNGIAAAPLLRADGTINSANGYDAASGMWCENVPDLDALVPKQPTKDVANSSLYLVRNTFKTFCFGDAETINDAITGVPIVDISKPPGQDESAFLVALLTAVCRPSLDLTPGVLLRAPSMSGAGAGKGLLTRCICTIAHGRDPHAVTAGTTLEELEKRIAAELIEANAVLLLDNVNNTALKSDLLASAITERPARVRLLGRSQMVLLNANALVVLTGNGLSVSEDLARRFITVELDPRTENPETRPFTGDIHVDVAMRRAELLAALLTIWRYGRIAIDIKQGLPLGSFQQWSQWVRDPLLALGCQDPVARVSEAKHRDADRQAIADLYAIIWANHQDRPFQFRQLHPDVIKALDPHGRGRQNAIAHLGNLVGTRVSGFVLTRQRAAGMWGRATYALERAT
jgi:hypothetical protein